MDRRDLFRLGAVAGVSIVGTTGVPVAAEPRAARLWREYRAAPDTHPQLPNVSYAGYHRGERRLPRPEVRVNVRWFGARGDGRGDDTAAINTAIESVGRAGGGVVLLPAGTYRISGLIRMHHSHVVLRGEGKDATTIHCDASLEEGYAVNRRGEISQWSWMGGLVWFVPRRRLETLRAASFFGVEGWMDNEPLTPVRPGPVRGDTVLTVAAGGGLRAGDDVLLAVRNVADSSLLAHLCGDVPGTRSYPWETAARRLRPELTDWTGAPNMVDFRWPVRIAAVRGDTVRLAQPLRVDLRPGWRPRLETLGPVVRESGIEHLTMRMRETAPPEHHQETGFNGPCFQSAMDCWARDVHVEHPDTGFGLVSAKNITLTGVSVGGRRSHHPYLCRVQSHDNLVTGFRLDGPTLHGLNTEGFSAGNVWADGVMAHGTFDSHKMIPFDSVRTAITVTNDGSTGGAGDAGPRWGARMAHWNVEVVGGRPHGIRIEEHAPRSAVVGVRGTSGHTDHEPDFAGPLGSAVEALDEQAVPADLYRAQLRHRLG